MGRQVIFSVKKSSSSSSGSDSKSTVSSSSINIYVLGITQLLFLQSTSHKLFRIHL